jgi:hypothetical protein
MDDVLSNQVDSRAKRDAVVGAARGSAAVRAVDDRLRSR